jgi:hypothetical protein
LSTSGDEHHSRVTRTPSAVGRRWSVVEKIRAAADPVEVSCEVVARIHAERAAGKSLHQIAADLNTDGTPTAHGGRRWWPSSVRAVLSRV